MMERVEYIKKTFFEILHKQYDDNTLATISFPESEPNKKKVKEEEYKKAEFYEFIPHTNLEWEINGCLLNCVYQIRFMFPDKTFIKCIELLHDITPEVIELNIQVHHLPGAKNSYIIIEEKLEAAKIFQAFDNKAGRIADYEINYTAHMFIIRYYGLIEFRISYTRMDINDVHESIDCAIEEFRRRAGYVDRRNRCKKVIITLILCFKQLLGKYMTLKIGKLLLETRYDDEWK